MKYQRAPNFFELFGDRGAVIGNTDLASEEGHNSDWGVVFRGSADGVGLVLAEGAYYRNHLVNSVILCHFVEGRKSCLELKFLLKTVWKQCTQQCISYGKW